MSNEITDDNKVKKMIDSLVEKAKKASEEYLKLDQEQVNNIVKAMSMAGLEHHMELAKMAVEETGRGIYEDCGTSALLRAAPERRTDSVPSERVECKCLLFSVRQADIRNGRASGDRPRGPVSVCAADNPEEC